MRHIDVTLRDGGHQNGFQWPFELVKKHIQTLDSVPEVGFIELGYWGQKDKYDGWLYCIDKDVVASLPSVLGKYSIMIDYHYCSHNLDDYFSKGELDQVGLIRLTSRSTDVESAVNFGRSLKKHTGSLLSLNFFNITNYSTEQIKVAVSRAIEAEADFIYFADTHGSLDLMSEFEKYQEFASQIVAAGIVPGLHLHDHSGKAYMNYRLLESAGYQISDVSLGGVGKGMGNLKLEHVIQIKGNEQLLDELVDYPMYFKMPSTVYGSMTSQLSIVDHYAVEAEDLRIKPNKFSEFLDTLTGESRDVYDPDLLTKYLMRQDL